MDIIHSMTTRVLPRHAQAALADRLRVMPAVVVVSGARQTGKSTLAQDLTPGARRFISLDDLDAMELARRDPEALVEGSPVTLLEVQREPDLLRAVKRAIDRDRRAGRFLLTGSANLLLMRGVSESLAGRASYLTLWPMARREQQDLGRCGLWEELLGSKAPPVVDELPARDRAPTPPPALTPHGGQGNGSA